MLMSPYPILAIMFRLSRVRAHILLSFSALYVLILALSILNEGYSRRSVSYALNVISVLLSTVTITVCPSVVSQYMTYQQKFKMSNTIGATGATGSGAETATITDHVT